MKTLVYHTLLLTALIFCIPVILPLVLTSRKRRRTVLQRLGLVGLPPGGAPRGKSDKIIWIHALSVGETFASVELVKKLRQKAPTSAICFSVSTDTGFDEAEKRLGDVADLVFFYPYDFVFAVRKALRRIRPSLFVLVESDIWPTFLFELKKMNVPAILVNGRLSPASFAGYKRVSFLMRPVFNTFQAVCVQSPEQGERFEKIGVLREKIKVTGSMKFDRGIPGPSRESAASLKKSLAAPGGAKLFLAGSTHPGEETVVLKAFSILKKANPDLSLVLVPRDPERADEVCRLAARSGFRVKKMSRNDPGESDVLVVDVMGILAELYAVADVAFVGGSLAPFGGHNPLEPAAFSKPVLFGPDMTDFPEISRMLLSAKGAIQVKNAAELAATAARLLSDPVFARRTGENALSVFQANQGAVEKTAAVVTRIFRDSANG